MVTYQSTYKRWAMALLAGALLPLLPFEQVQGAGVQYPLALWRQHTGLIWWALLLLPGLHLAWCYRRRCTPAVWPAAVCAGWLLLYALHKGSYYLPAPPEARLYTRPAVGWYAALLLAGCWAWLGWQQYRHRRQPAA